MRRHPGAVWLNFGTGVRRGLQLYADLSALAEVSWFSIAHNHCCFGSFLDLKLNDLGVDERPSKYTGQELPCPHEGSLVAAVGRVAKNGIKIRAQ